jgi:hypothetical protein
MPNLVFDGASWVSLCLLRELQETTVAHTMSLMCAGICTESRCADVFFLSGNLPRPTQNHTTFKIAVDSATTSMEHQAIPFFQSEISQCMLMLS